MNKKLAVVARSAIILILFWSAASISTGKDAAGANAQSESDKTLDIRHWTKSTTVGQIVADRPQTARIFELVDIDYCCGGQTSLESAALNKKVNVEKLLAALSSVGVASPDADQRNWQRADIGELIDHIVTRHHAWLRKELPSLVETTKTVH